MPRVMHFSVFTIISSDVALIYYRGLENRVSWVRFQPEQFFPWKKSCFSCNWIVLPCLLCCGPVDCSSCIIIIQCIDSIYQSCSYRHVYSRHVISPQLTVRCHRKLRRQHHVKCGEDLIINSHIYFTRFYSNSVYSYQWSTEIWREKIYLVGLTNYSHYDRGNGLRNTLQWTPQVPRLLLVRLMVNIILSLWLVVLVMLHLNYFKSAVEHGIN